MLAGPLLWEEFKDVLRPETLGRLLEQLQQLAKPQFPEILSASVFCYLEFLGREVLREGMEALGKRISKKFKRHGQSGS